MVTPINNDDLKKLLSHTESLMNHVYCVRQDLSLEPANQHIASCINYVDLKEYRNEFIEELLNTICEWVYSQEKAQKIIDDFIQIDSRTPQNANSKLRSLALKKFRKSSSDALVMQGQFGELLLFNFLQHFFQAVPLLRKMPITTSDGHERFGSDAIHYSRRKETNLLLLGESKAYTSNYKFSQAFADSLESILKTYVNLNDELDLYLYDDFIDPKLERIAKAYKDGKLKNVEIHLYCLISYNETTSFEKTSEGKIKSSIINIISQRCQKLDAKIYTCFKDKQALFKRLNYIIFPFWEFKSLIEKFQNRVGN